MSGCPTVHEHPEFQKSFNPQDKNQVKEVIKLKRFLKSNSADFIGEDLKYEMTPLKSFPRGHKNVRCLFILCRDCKKEALDPKCSFCESSGHSMQDAVLFHINSHDSSYKEGEKAFQKYKPE